MQLSTDLFDYNLPNHLIAQTPAAHRDASRLMVVNRANRTISHHVFTDLPQFLRAGDMLFRNNAAVLPARLHANRPTGGAIECFLLRPDNTAEDSPDREIWWCLVRPGKKLPVGATFAHGNEFSGLILAKDSEGAARIEFTTTSGESLTEIANRIGDVPLPPYIERADPDAVRPRDIERYQTVYADRARQVAVAAPTAGLHFTPELLAQLPALGVNTADVTLHVGLGTFKPITTDHINDHPIHRELYEVPPETQHALRNPTGRRIAVGTTTVRTLEDHLAKHSVATDQPVFDEAGIYIYPPRTFAGVDVLITNFHQPRSTLLCLVSAFLTPGSTDGIDWLREIYAEAIADEYRFFSYGDAMLIL